MTKNLLKNKYIVLVLIAAITFNFLFLPLTVFAQIEIGKPIIGVPPNPLDFFGKTLSWIGGETLLFVSSGISGILGAFFGVFIYLEAQIIDYLLSPSNFSFTNAPIVALGWGITRDLANMFFILILLIIAFATVLRIKSWAISQLWWKVVVAALLINFSLVIAGFVIDFTQILTQFFLKQITGGGVGTMTTKLAASMQILNFYNPARPDGGNFAGIAQFGASSVAAFVGILLTLVGLVVTAFVFGAAMIFLIVRIIYIWVLLIFAPIVWMLWILPETSGQFSRWWSSFLNWTFFAPIFVFMIYLSLSIFDKNGQFNTGVFPKGNSAWGTAAPGLTTVGMPAAIFQWILVIGLMFGSLIVAKSFGVYGAAASQKILTGWGANTKNWAGRQLRRRALSIGAKEAAPGVEARPGLLVRGAEKIAALPGGKILTGAVFRQVGAEAKTIEDAQKQFANWSPDAIKNYLKTPGGAAPSQLGAALALKEKGQLEKIDPDPVKAEARVRELVSLASRYSPKDVDKLLEVAPHLATEFNKKVEIIVAKIEKADKIMLSSLANSEVVLNLNPNQLRDIAQKADDAKVQKVKDTVESEFTGLAAPLKAEINRILVITNKDRRNRELNTFLDNQTAAGASRDDVRKIEKIARSRATTKSPAWQI